MRRIGQTFSDVCNYMRRHKLKFGYGLKYPSLKVVVRPDEPGTVSNNYHKTLKTGTDVPNSYLKTLKTGTDVSDSYCKTLKTGTDTQTYLNKLPVVSPTPNENKTNTFKVKQLTPSQNKVRELTPMRIKVRKLIPVYTSDTEGRDMPPPLGMLILGTTQYDDDEANPSGKYDDAFSGECLVIEGKFNRSNANTDSIITINSNVNADSNEDKSPEADTDPIINSHITDTASNSYKSLTADTDLNTNNNPINGLITYKPKTLPLAHKSNQSLIIDTNYTKTHYTNACYFTCIFLEISRLSSFRTMWSIR